MLPARLSRPWRRGPGGDRIGAPRPGRPPGLEAPRGFSAASGRRHWVEDLTRALRVDRAARTRGDPGAARRSAQALLGSKEDKPPANNARPAAQTGQAASTAPDVKRTPPRRPEWWRRSQRPGIRPRAPEKRPVLRSGSGRESLERTQAGEADPKESPAPFRQRALDELYVAVGQARGNLRGRVACLHERIDKLLVNHLGPARRLDPERKLGRRVKGVLKPRQLAVDVPRRRGAGSFPRFARGAGEGIAKVLPRGSATAVAYSRRPLLLSCPLLRGRDHTLARAQAHGARGGPGDHPCRGRRSRAQGDALHRQFGVRGLPGDRGGERDGRSTRPSCASLSP